MVRPAAVVSGNSALSVTIITYGNGVRYRLTRYHAVRSAPAPVARDMVPSWQTVAGAWVGLGAATALVGAVRASRGVGTAHAAVSAAATSKITASFDMGTSR